MYDIHILQLEASRLMKVSQSKRRDLDIFSSAGFYTVSAMKFKDRFRFFPKSAIIQSSMDSMSTECTLKAVWVAIIILLFMLAVEQSLPHKTTI